MSTFYLLLLFLSGICSPALSRTISDDEWSVLNETVGGKLGRGVPISRPCFSIFDGKNVSMDPDACAELQANYLDPGFRVPQFGAYMQVGPSSSLLETRLICMNA